MAKKNVYLHIGPALPGTPAPHAALRGHDSLRAVGLAAPKVEQTVMDLADIEIRRRHKAVGLRRKQVEGMWAEVCRRAFKKSRKGWDVVISQPGFVDADYRQVALALDGLVGLRLHLVVTAGRGLTADELRALVGDWGKFLKKQGRLHVLTLEPDATPEQFVEAFAGLAGAEAHAAAA